MKGRFCSLDQTHSKCESTLVEIMSFRPRNRVTTKKKGLLRKLKSFCRQNQVSTKKKGLHHNSGLNIRPEFVGLIHAARLFFVFSTRALTLMGGR